MSLKTIPFVEVTEGAVAGTINLLFTESVVFAVDQRVTIGDSTEYTNDTFPILALGGGFINITGTFTITDEGTLTFLDFPTEVLEPDSGQQLVRYEDNSLTTYGENYLFTLKTSLDEVKAFLQETFPT